MSTLVNTVPISNATRAPVPPVENARAPSAVSTQAIESPFEIVDARDQSSDWGQWIFNHKHSFSRDNPLAWYGIRNVLNNMVSIVGLMATIVPVRAGMGHVAKWAEAEGKHNVQKIFGSNMMQNSLGVGVSFATFRTLYKMGQRAYDRVFIKPEDASSTTQAIHDLPHRWLADFKQIAPAEYPATMVAAFGLVGIRAAFTAPAASLRASHWQDVAACALFAYPVFFEITEHLGRDFQLSRGYDTKETNEHINKDKQTVKELFTRQIPGVAAGIVPYIATNNIWYRSTGRQASYKTSQLVQGIREIDGFGKAFWKERPYQAFWMFSLGRDLYFDTYDKWFGPAKSTASDINPASKPKHARYDQHGDYAEGVIEQGEAEHIPYTQVHDISLQDKAMAHASQASQLTV